MQGEEERTGKILAAQNEQRRRQLSPRGSSGIARNTYQVAAAGMSRRVWQDGGESSKEPIRGRVRTDRWRESGAVPARGLLGEKEEELEENCRPLNS